MNDMSLQLKWNFSFCTSVLDSILCTPHCVCLINYTFQLYRKQWQWHLPARPLSGAFSRTLPISVSWFRCGSLIYVAYFLALFAFRRCSPLPISQVCSVPDHLTPRTPRMAWYTQSHPPRIHTPTPYCGFQLGLINDAPFVGAALLIETNCRPLVQPGGEIEGAGGRCDD